MPRLIPQPLLLYIDDCEADGELLRIMLRQQRIKVELAKTGKQGMEVYDAAQHDAVAIDYNLSDGEGGEVARKILLQHPEARICLISGQVEEEQRQTAAALGIRCIEKSMDMEHIRLISEFMAGLRPQENPSKKQKVS